MEHVLTCNNLKCRKELGDRALVTTCSHIFCLECAPRLGLTGQETPRRATCPACNSQLANPDDAVVANLNPSEDYKTSVLSGLSPNLIMECAGRALSFWAYQATQDIYYQQYLYKTLTEKYSTLNLRLDQTVNDANSEIDNLQNKLSNFTTEFDTLRRKNEELAQAYREKSRKLLQIQELYDKVKRKAEMGHIQRAASDAVDSTLHAAPSLNAQGVDAFHATHTSQDTDGHNMAPAFAHSHNRFDVVGRNSSIPRGNTHRPADEHRWPGSGLPPRSSIPGIAVASAVRQRVGNHSMLGSAGLQGFPNTHALSGASRRLPDTGTPSFAQSRGGLAGIGLTSELKVSQPTNAAGLDASVRGN